MEKDESGRFSWSGLFVVTAVCSFLFNIAVRVLDGHYSRLLFWIGGIAVLLGLLNRLARMASREKRLQS